MPSHTVRIARDPITALAPLLSTMYAASAAVSAVLISA
jgi:hypothetical protein